MIDRMLPPFVATHAVRHDPQEAELLPQEEEHVRRAVPHRRAEYATVRWCARQALSRFGIHGHPLVKGQAGEPHWPDGVVGSLTHCRGFRAAAVALREHVRSVGIDAEPHEPLPHGVLDAIADDGEKEHVRLMRAAHPAMHWDRMLFSAKESIYKAWYPVVRHRLTFDEARIRFAPDGSFTADLVMSPTTPWPTMAGSWQVEDGVLATSVVTH